MTITAAKLITKAKTLGTDCGAFLVPEHPTHRAIERMVKMIPAPATLGKAFAELEAIKEVWEALEDTDGRGEAALGCRSSRLVEFITRKGARNKLEAIKRLHWVALAATQGFTRRMYWGINEEQMPTALKSISDDWKRLKIA